MAGSTQPSTRPVRRLRFESVAACVNEVERIIAAEQAGRLRACGNWTAGQVMAHVAAWIEYGYEGFPIGPPPFFVRWILRWQLTRLLNKGLSPGVRIPRVPGGTTGIDDIDALAAGTRLLVALRRLDSSEPAPFDSPAFGPLSDADRVRLNLRHAELHLGFLAYETDGA